MEYLRTEENTVQSQQANNLIYMWRLDYNKDGRKQISYKEIIRILKRISESRRNFQEEYEIRTNREIEKSYGKQNRSSQEKLSFASLVWISGGSWPQDGN